MLTRKVIVLSVLSLIHSVLLYSHTMEIHGIKLTHEEELYIESNPVIRVANEMDWPPFDYNEFGKPKGLAIDYIKLVASKVGLEIEFVSGYTWIELLAMLENKEIDIVPALYKNKEREAYTLYSDPYYIGRLGVYGRTDDLSISNHNDLEGKRVGIQTAHGSIPYIIDEIPEISLIEVDTTAELVKLLALNKLDAIIGNPLLFHYNSREYQITNIELKNYIDFKNNEKLSTYMHIGVRNDKPLLHSIINKASNSITDQEKKLLVDRWTSSIVVKKINLTEKEKQYLINNPVIRVSNEMDYAPFDFMNGKEPQGYSIDLIKILAERAGLEVEFVNGYSWAKLEKMLFDGELDLLHTISKTRAREQKGLYSEPFHSYKNYWFVLEDEDDINSINELFGKTVVVGEGWAQSKFLKEHFPDIDLLLVDNIDEMIDAVATGKANAMISSTPVMNYYLNKRAIFDFKKSSWFKEYDRGEYRRFHFYAQYENSDLISMLNKALNSLTSEELEDLNKRWFGSSNSVSGEKPVSLTINERNYLNNNEIILTAQPDRMPYHGFDKSGNLIGIAADYIESVEESLGIKFKVISTKTDKDFTKIYNSSSPGLFLCEAEKNRGDNLNMSASYVKSPVVIATGADQLFIEDIKNYLGNEIAVVEGSYLKWKLPEKFPGIKLVPVSSVKEGLKRVRSGDLFGFIDSSAVIGYAIQNKMMLDVKIAGTLDLEREMAINVKSEDPILFNIITKSLNHISNEEKRRIYNKWIAVKYERGVDYSLIIRVIIAAFIIVSITVYWNWRLMIARKQTQRAVEALKLAQKDLKIKNEELGKLAITDRLTGLVNRMRLDEVLKNEIIRFNRSVHELSVIMLDIDHFKNINDTHGHIKGDQVLKDVAKTITSNIRENDISGRWGGEEFIIICPGTNLEGAIVIAEKLRAKIESLGSESELSLTGSFGVAQISEGDKGVDLIRKADDALYKAKRAGRNRVES